MRTKLLCTALASALSMVALPAAAQYVDTHAQTFSQTIFFGDSLTDAGFFRPLLPAAGQPVMGQFTTNPGTTWAQDVANYYGVNQSTGWTAAGPDSGSNYAVGGARVGGVSASAPSLDQQVNFYLSRTGGRADPNALYGVWGGANDLRAITTPASAPAIMGGAIAADVGIVMKLQAAGARYIMVPNIPDIGLTPESLAAGPVTSATATALSANYNAALYSAMASNHLRIIPLDTFHMLQEIVASPATYGFRDVTHTACGTGSAPAGSSLTCGPQGMGLPSSYAPGADQAYAFADGIHPSTAAHKILGD
ncbi:MAG: SGNH/GDSL hydrolase family protein, partial [Xanthomonadales bacterium]|nr:SGNH/GDSL hydrolase family protein [Xanthomonadales bacterium]